MKRRGTTSWAGRCAAILVAIVIIGILPDDGMGATRRFARHGPAAAAQRGKVAGSVITTAQHPVARALVRLRPAGHVLRHHHVRRRAARTGPRGHFALRAPAGRYLVVASKRGLGSTRAFTTVAAGQTQTLTLTLRCRRVVHGRVVHPRSGPTPQPPSRAHETKEAPRHTPIAPAPAQKQPVLPPTNLPKPKPGPQPR